MSCAVGFGGGVLGVGVCVWGGVGWWAMRKVWTAVELASNTLLIYETHSEMCNGVHGHLYTKVVKKHNKTGIVVCLEWEKRRVHPPAADLFMSLCRSPFIRSATACGACME